MDCARNIITAAFPAGKTETTTAPLWQWDYGQALCITGIDLPAAFEVHFSTNRTGGVSTVAVGADGQVTIPNDLLTIGKNLNAWIYLSDSEGEGETEYSILIPVKARPMPETYDAEASGEFDDVVRQVSEYSQTAQTAADNAGASASAAATSAFEAVASASAAETAKNAAETAQGKAEDAQTAAESAAQTATQKAQQTAQDAAQAALDAGRAESAAGRAEAAQTGAESAKTDAETAAQGAADSASAASASATSAGQAATSAAQSATAAAGSATTAQGAAQTATTKAGEASASATAAAASETAAQTAQTAAETAAGTATASATTAATKAGEAAQSASNAAQSKTDAEAAATRAETAAASLTVDSALSDSSTNPVQNKVITGEVTQVKSALFKTIIPTSYSTGYIGSDGSAVTSDTNYYFCDYTEIPFITKISTKVSMLSSRGMAFYDKDKTFISAINGNNCSDYGYTAAAKPQMINVPVPAGARYIRSTQRTTAVTGVLDFAITGVYMGDYIADLPNIETTLANVVNEAKDNTDSRKLDVSFTNGGFITGGGAISSHTAYSYTDYIYVGGLKSLKMPMLMSGSGASIVLYDKTKTVTRNFKNPSDPVGTILNIELTDTEVYIRISCYTSQKSKFYLICDDISESITKTFRVLSGEDDVPMSKIIRDGGMTRIFNTMGVIGDSLSSGEMAYGNASGEDTTEYTDMYQYSWIQYLARACGTTALNFSQGGMNTENFLTDTGGQLTKFQNPNNKCQAYFIALGHNDLNYGVPVGSPSDINISDPTQDPDTFYGNYAHIIALIKQIQPNAKIFCVCMKSSHFAAYNVAIRYMPTIFSNVYVLDFETYYPLLESSWEYTQGHGNAMGYLNYSWQIGTFVDWIIRNNRTDFKYVQFIGTDYDQYIPT